MAKVYDTPSHVTAEDGVVVVDGPDGVDVSLTPEAAGDISDRLLKASADAAGQAKAKAEKAAEQTHRHR